MNIYWGVLTAVIILGIMMPQEGYAKKYYVILMTVIHTFICAFRYEYLAGDLIKYHTEFSNMQSVGYFSKEAIHNWRNTGFYWLMKFVGGLSNENYKLFLIVIAIFTCVVTAVLIYKYSPKPWLSFTVWNCMTFYVLYDFLAIKQGLAMAILMLAMMCVFEKKLVGFLIYTLMAGFIHMPALIFLPAYFIANRKLNNSMIAIYIISAVAIFITRRRIVDWLSDVYYDDSFTLVSEGIGGRVVVIVLILLAGLFMKGFREKIFSQLFNIVVVAAILQMFSGFDNVFTRLADYYLQFTILFIPMIFYESKNTEIDRDASPALFSFDKKSVQLIVAVLVVILIWWYRTTFLGITISNEVDNFINYRFMWQ